MPTSSRSDAALGESAGFLQSTLDSLATHLAILNDHGTIIWVNAAWNHFAVQNGFKGSQSGLGINYLGVCEAARGSSSTGAAAVAGGIRAIMAGHCGEFQWEYPCHGPREQRWFSVRITRFAGEGPLRVVVTHENITARKLTETALHANEARLRLALAAGGLGAFEHNLNDNLLSVSPEFCQILGWPPQATYPHAFWIERIHPDDQGAVAAGVQRMVRERTSLDIEYRLNLPNGSVRWIRAMASPVVLQGEVKRVHGVVQEITKRKQAEAELRRFSRAVAQSPVSVVITDLQGDIEYVNPKFSEVTGYSFAEVRGKNPRILKSGEMPGDAYQQLWAAITAGGEWHGEFHNRKKNGDLYWELASISPVRDDAGKVTHFIAIKEDVTSAKKWEAALRESDRRQKAILDNIPDSAWLKDAHGRFLAVNQPLCAFLGRTPENIIGKTLSEIHPPHAAALEKGDDEAIRSGKSVRDEHCVPDAEGQSRWLESVESPIFDEGGGVAGIAGIARDITERKRVLQELANFTQFLDCVINTVGEPIFVKDRQHRWVVVNEASCALVGRSRLEFLGKTVRDFFPKSEADALWSGDEEVFHTGRESISEETITDASGKMHTVVTRKNLYRNTQGEQFIVGVLHDITESKKLEVELRLSEQRQRAILDNIPDPAWLRDRDGRFLMVNRAWCDLAGIAATEALGKKNTEIGMYTVEATSGLRDDDQFVISTGKLSRRELQLHFKGREAVWFEVSKTALFDEQGNSRGAAGIARDITERKRTDEAQKAQILLSERLAKLAANAPGIIYSFRLRPDGSTCIPYISPTVTAFCGVRPEDLLDDAAPILDLIPLEDRLNNKETIAESARTLRPWRNEFRLRHPQKGLFWVEGQSTPEREVDGGTLWHGFMSDISERKRAEQALRDSEEKFRQLADNINDVFWVTSPDHDTVHYVSPGYELIWGLSREPLYTHPHRWAESILPEDRGRVHDAIVTSLMGTAATANLEYRITRPDGTVRWIHDRGFQVRDASGNLVRLAGIASDITPRKVLEMEMEQLRLEQETILNTLGEGLHWIDVDGHIKFENPAAAQLLGYEVCELIGQSAHETMHHTRPDGSPHPKCDCPIYLTLRDKQTRHITDDVFWRKDGTCIPVDYTCTPALYKDGRSGGTVVVFRDITARKQAQAVLADLERRTAEHKANEVRSRLELEREHALNQMKGRFVSLVSHEFRTPLCAINMAAYMLADYAAGMTEAERTEHARSIQFSVGRMTSMMEDFLTHDKAHSGKMACHPTRVNLEKFCQELIPEVLNSTHLGRHVECTIDPTAREVCVDEKYLRHILGNLLSNAVKYSGDDQPVSVAARRLTNSADSRLAPGDYLQLQVADSGIGIPAADLAKLYQTFHRAGNVGNRPGTGMGLAIVKQFVDLHGGTIQVESTVGNGTTFWVWLPHHPTAPSPAKMAEPLRSSSHLGLTE